MKRFNYAKLNIACLTGLLIFAFSFLILPAIHAQKQTADVMISNIASAEFVNEVSGKEYKVDSNIVYVRIQPLEALILEQDQSIIGAAGSSVTLPHKLTNTGNTESTYTIDVINLTNDDYDLANLLIYIDVNGNMIYDSGEPALQNGGKVTLKPGEHIDLLIKGIISATVEPGKTARIKITATTQLQNVSDSNIDEITAVKPGAIMLNKSASTLKPKPGDNVKYTIKAQIIRPNIISGIDVFVDGNPEKLIIISDNIPANTQFVNLEGPGYSTLLYHIRGEMENSYVTVMPSDKSSIDKAAVGFENFLGIAEVSFDLTVKVSETAAEKIPNTANYIYKDSTSDETITGPSNTVVLIPQERPPVINYYTNDQFVTIATLSHLGDPLYLQITEYPSPAVNPAYQDSTKIEVISVTFTSELTGDQETFDAIETGADTGIFRVMPPVPTQNANDFAAAPGNGIMEVLPNDKVTASAVDAAGYKLSTFIYIDTYGVVYDSGSNAPIENASVTIIDVAGTSNNGKPGEPAIVYMPDETTIAPSTVVTGPDGRFAFPLLLPGIYRIEVTPPDGYKFPSVVSPDQLPAGRVTDVSGSYGKEFAIVGKPSSIYMDIPLDLVAQGSLTVQKTASRNYAEIGDFVDYKILIKNESGLNISDVKLVDNLPAGFNYIKESAAVDGAAIQDPIISAGAKLTFSIGDIAPNQQAALVYRVKVGPGAMQGDGINRAQANGTIWSGDIQSNVAMAAVKINEGVFTDKGVVIGRVFIDDNKNGIYDENELGIPGIRLYMENGNYVITDKDGKYSFYGVTPTTHIIKIDITTAPQGSDFRYSNTRQSNSETTAFVDLKNAEMHKTNFREVSGLESVRQNVEDRRSNMKKVFSEIEYGLKATISPDGKPRLQSDRRGLAATGIVNGKVEGSAFKPVPGKIELDSKNSNLPEAKSTWIKAPLINLEERMISLDNTFDFIDIKDGDTLAIDQINVRIKGMMGSTFKLVVNGKEITDDRVGKKAVLESAQLEAWEYIGVNLNGGENTINASMIDQFGNEREKKEIKVIAPGSFGKLKVQYEKRQYPADGKTLIPFKITIADDNDVVISSRTLVTLETDKGSWDVEDINNTEPGIQVYIEGGSGVFNLKAPVTPGNALIRISSGMFEEKAAITFVPELRPMMAIGLIDGIIRVHDLDFDNLVPARKADGFEQELANMTNSGSIDTGIRAALFLKGKIKGDYLLTARYDTDKDTEDRMFRDIQPDEYYPVYGDVSTRGYDAQSTSKLYIRVDKNRTYLLYGDFTTWETDSARSLGAYSRSLTGSKFHYETDKAAFNAFASYDSSRQIIQVFAANGTSGPFDLNTDGRMINSERVEIITRDRNHRGLIISTKYLSRYTDYNIEYLTGSLIIKFPVPSLDSNLNPIFIRVTYELDEGGPKHWVTGVDGQYKVTDKIELGASWVKDDDQLRDLTMYSMNASFALNPDTTLVTEYAHTERSILGSGSAKRFELLHDSKKLSARVYAGESDLLFDNSSSNLSRGRSESGIKLLYKYNNNTKIKAEGIKSRDLANENNSEGLELAVEKAYKNNTFVEVGIRRARDEAKTYDNDGEVKKEAIDFTSVRLKLTGQLPKAPQTSIYGEYEQDINDASKKVLALGGDYQFANRGRLYARHEFISSLQGRYTLNTNKTQNITVFGIDTDYMKGGRLFSEYRAKDSLSGLQTEAAIGLRNMWDISPKLKINASLEQIKSLEGETGNNTFAITGGFEYKDSEKFRNSTRIEYRKSANTHSYMATIGAAAKLNRDWTFLGRNVWNLMKMDAPNNGRKLQERLQLGFAYRQADEDEWNGLAKYEFRKEDDSTSADFQYKRYAHIFSADLNYQPSSKDVYSAHYAVKLLNEKSNGITSDSITHLAQLRYTRDLSEDWDIGVIASKLLTNDSRSQTGGLGFEVGYRVKRDVWTSIGYNVFGFKDPDFSNESYTNKGLYLRIRVKFDENSF